MDSIDILQKVAPETIDLIEERYIILRTVHAKTPIGRRALAADLNLSERNVRSQLDSLEEYGLISRSRSGVSLSKTGEQILICLRDWIRKIRGLAELEQEMEKLLKLKEVIIVPGDSDQDISVKQDLAKTAARYLPTILKPGDILAVTGGTTLAEIVNNFIPTKAQRNVVVVPARGGLGEDVELQANTIAAKFALRLGGTYRLLHAPDYVEPNLMDTMLREPSIREVVSLGRRAQVLLHGVGTAEEMARRRGIHEDHLMQLIADGAVGEAFGYYFNHQGGIVYSTASVGIRLEDLAKIPLVVGVGGGKSKAWAMLSVLHPGFCDVCITDEGVARKVIQIIKNKEEN